MKRTDLRDLVARAIGEETAVTEDTIALQAGVAGEMAIQDVPIGQGVDIDAIKAGDDDPLEVVVSVSAGKSKRGWYYTKEALAKIAGEVNNGGLPGYTGHLKPEDVGSKFEWPVTHWVGAKQDGDRFYFRGIVDKAAGELKRLIRAKRITQTSIFGVPKLARVGGETKVVDYEPISIDWTPLKRAGMPSAIVALGEMDSITEPGATAPEQRRTEVTLEELLAELRKHKAAPDVVIGEMAWKEEDILAALDVDKAAGEQALATLKAITDAYGEMSSDDIVAAIKAGREAEENARKSEHSKVVDEVLTDKVAGETAQAFVRDLLQLKGDEDKGAIETAVGEIMERPHVKAALKTAHRTAPVAPKNSTGGSTTEPQRRRVAI